MWLLNEEVARSMQHARRAGLAPTSEQIGALNTRVRETEARDGGMPRNLVLAGSVAEIRVVGVLTKAPDWMAMYFGGGNTTYTDIINALAIARSDTSIKEVRLFVDSPGGTVDGLFDTLAAIEMVRSEKKMTVRASNAQSAAYAIAAAAGRIEATNPGAQFGSIGTAVSYFVDDAVVTLTNTDSPDKRPDVTTEEGQATIVRYLDALNELFVEAIARGRGNVTSARVKSEFGRGATLLAADAKRLGMIDAIAKPALRALSNDSASAASITADATSSFVEAAQNQTTAPAQGVAQIRKVTMTEAELRAQHPELYDSVFHKGKAAGVTEGEALGSSKERDRVVAHLTMGKQAADLETALTAIESGEGMTLTMTAKYLAAGMNRADRSIRQSESDAAGAVVDGAKPTSEVAKDMGDLVAAALTGMKGN